MSKVCVWVGKKQGSDRAKVNIGQDMSSTVYIFYLSQFDLRKTGIV
jgi:hypothetical protein